MAVKVHTVNDPTGDIPLLECCKILDVIYVVSVVVEQAVFEDPVPSQKTHLH